MVPELRKLNRQVWRLWAVILPAGFVLAIALLPPKAVQPAVVEVQPRPLSNVVLSRDDGWLVSALRTENGYSGAQLEITLKTELRAPATRVLWQNMFLGTLGAKGIHRFHLDSALTTRPPYTLKIEDPVNQTVLYKTTFN